MIFEEVKPLYQKTDAGYEGLGVDVLEQIRIQAKRRKVDYRVAKSVNDGIGAVITGKADIACGVAFTWGRSTQVTYSLPFGIGGTRLLMASDTTFDGTPALLEGQTIGVVKDTASAQVLKNVLPCATLKSYTTPKEALDTFHRVPSPSWGRHPMAGRQQPYRQDGTAALPSLRSLRHQLHRQPKQRQAALLHQHRVGPDDAGLHGW